MQYKYTKESLRNDMNFQSIENVNSLEQNLLVSQ